MRLVAARGIAVCIGARRLRRIGGRRCLFSLGRRLRS